MTSEKFWEIAIGVIALIVIFKLILPLLTGIFYTIAVIVLVIVAIGWLLRLGGIIK